MSKVSLGNQTADREARKAAQYPLKTLSLFPVSEKKVLILVVNDKCPLEFSKTKKKVIPKDL